VKSLLLALFATLGLAASVKAASAADVIARWLEAQAELVTWSADVTQTRTLKALTHPLRAEGRVWFAAPHLFRWELGAPPQTIAVRTEDEMFVIYPRLKRAERYPMKTAAAGQWGDALTLLEAGFPRSRGELEERFTILAADVRDGICELRLQPRSPAARRMISEIRVAFSTEDLMLRSTELHFADGSTLRNDFSRPTLNQPLDPDLFEPEITPEFKVVEPLGR
jgi:outer membrane lipoprotein-sorting protein